MRRAPALIPLRALASVALASAARRAPRPPEPSPRRLRLMHVVLSLNVGGLERMVLELARATDPARYQVEVCCLDEPGDLAPGFAPLGIPVTSLGLTRVGGGAVLEALVARMRAAAPDVVHTHNVLAHKFGALAARCAGVPVVVHTKHGRNYVRHPFEQPKSPVYGHLLSWITDRIVAVSDDVRDVCHRYELVPSSKLVTIVNGVDVTRFDLSVDRPALLRELGIPADARVIGNVARFVVEKDHATLVRAFERVLAAVPQAVLLLVGDGALLDETARLCRELGLGERVRLLGRRADVPQLLRILDVFALSSTTEGTSISLLEAMAAQVPVVATAVGGNPELVADGTTGLLCPPRDPAALAARIVELLADPARARALAAAGRAKVIAGYGLARTAAAYTRLYEEILARKGLALPAGDVAGA